MDPLSALLFLLLGGLLFSLWRQHNALALLQQRHDVQIARMVSDIESEKGTRRRANAHINAQLSLLGRLPLPTNNDSQTQD